MSELGSLFNKKGNTSESCAAKQMLALVDVDDVQEQLQVLRASQLQVQGMEKQLDLVKVRDS